MPEPIQLAPNVTIAESALRFTFVRSSGPGGQSTNKVNSQAQLRVAVVAIDGLDDAARERLRSMAGQRLTDEDDILIRASEERSQVRNRRACIVRLRDLVTRAAVRPKTRRKKRRSRASIERRLNSKRQRSEKKSRRRWQGD